MTNKFHSAMDLVAELNKSHGVTQRGGKQYTEVAKRVEAFRITFGGEYGILTEILQNDEKTVVVRALVKDKDGFVVGSGIAEEIRNSSAITRTSAVEVCETSAIGRALASLGLHGGQYASANEIEGVGRKEQALKAITHKAEKANMALDLDDRIDALITFYENCDADKFQVAEKKYEKMLNTIGITEQQYDAIKEAHDKRKLELQL